MQPKTNASSRSVPASWAHLITAVAILAVSARFRAHAQATPVARPVREAPSSLVELAGKWTAPFQPTKLQWLALVLQAGHTKGLCGARVCRLDIDYRPDNSGTNYVIYLDVTGLDATRKEVREASVAELDRIASTAELVFGMQAPPILLFERMSTFKGGSLVSSYAAKFDCVVKTAAGNERDSSKPFNFEQVCSPVNR